MEILFGVSEGHICSPRSVPLCCGVFTRTVFIISPNPVHPWSDRADFGEHVLNSLIFILNGEDWNWSSEQWCLCPRIVTLFSEISLLFYAS